VPHLVDGIACVEKREINIILSRNRLCVASLARHLYVSAVSERNIKVVVTLVRWLCLFPLNLSFRGQGNRCWVETVSCFDGVLNGGESRVSVRESFHYHYPESV